MSFFEDIETLIRARYPILYIQGSEETRIQDFLLKIAENRRKKVFEWSCNFGLVPAGTSIQSQASRHAPTREPLAALDEVVVRVEPALFLFKDLHPFLTRPHYAVIRRLKEIAIHLRHSFKTIVIISPVLEVPVELEKEITVVDFPPPSRQELTALWNSIVAEIEPTTGIAIELGPESRDRLIEAALGLTLGEAENVFAKILVRERRLAGEDVDEVLAEKRQIIRKNGLLEYFTTDETMENVGGLSVLKSWLRKRTRAFSREAREFGLPAPRGILILGVQGCGKSLCAKAVAQLWQVPLLRFDMGRMFGSLVGSSEENIRRAIAAAETIAPAILWVDEIDKAFAGSRGSGSTDSGTTARVLGTFLTWLSEKTSPVFIVATANDVTLLPPELLRKGRLDEIFFVDLPNQDEIMEVLAIHLAKRNRNPQQFDLTALAHAAAGFSGAEIEEAIHSALYDAFDVGEDLATRHVLEAMCQTVPLSRTMDDPINRLRSWAEGRARPASHPKSVTEM